MTTLPRPRIQSKPQPIGILRWKTRGLEGLRQVCAAAALVGLLLLACSFELSQEARGGDQPPTKSSDLFDATKVWTLNLRFTPERWAEMEPEGGVNPFDMSGFGMGMFLTPSVMRDGDTDRDGGLSEVEFRDLGERWFSAWDRDGDDMLDPKQLREGLKTVLGPPPGPGPGGGDGPPEMMLQARDGKRNGLSGMMGIEFEYVHAHLEVGGQTFPDVAVRYKGNGTFMESRASLKRSLKIDMNKYVKGQRLGGVTTFNLHNNVTDAGMMNEVLAYRLFRDAGVPAPRTAYARVFITVPGQHERRYFGLYSLVENVDKNFVADRKLGQGGAILKPSMPNVFTDLGDDWEAYQQGYDPKTDLTAAQKQRIIEFSRFVTNATDEEFAARLGEYVDLDEFARFMAVTAWIGDLDSILSTGQNYYVYLDPKSDRLRFIPWDKDHTFGSWIAGSQEEREQHSIREPWDGRKRFLERVFKVEAFHVRYLATLKAFAEEFAQPERIEALVKEIAAAIRPAVAEESALKLSRFDAVVAGKPLPGGGPFGFGPSGMPQSTSTLLIFARNRAASVTEQLVDKSEGYVFGRPKPGGPGGGMPEFHPEEMMEPALLKALDGDKDRKLGRDEFVGGFVKWHSDWGGGQAGTVSEDGVRNGLNKALPFPMFGMPPVDGPQPGDRE